MAAMVRKVADALEVPQPGRRGGRRRRCDVGCAALSAGSLRALSAPEASSLPLASLPARYEDEALQGVHLVRHGDSVLDVPVGGPVRVKPILAKTRPETWLAGWRMASRHSRRQ